MKKQTIVCIESNTSGSGFLFLKTALAMGFQVLFLTQNPEYYAFLKMLKLQIITINTSDLIGIQRLLAEYTNIKGIFSTSEYFIEVAATLAKSYGLPSNNLRAINQCRNKKLFYRQMEKRRLPVPKTWFIRTLEDLAEKKFPHYPLVVKPLMGSGSVGVKKCLDFSQLREHVAILSQMKKNERGGVGEEGALVQEYIEGAEYSAEYICCGSNYHLLGFTRKMTTGNPYFIESGHDFPFFSPKKLHEKVRITLNKFLESLGFDFGPAHIEFKIHNSDVVVIEINPRLAGGMIPELINHAYGIDLYRMILQLYTEGKLDISLKKPKGSSIRFFIPDASGQIIQLPEIDKLKRCRGVVDGGFSKSKGDSFKKMNDYRDRIGYLITAASDASKSKLFADQAIQCFIFEMKIGQSKVSIGRLSQEPHPLLQKINQGAQSESKRLLELELISEIDLVHVLMLYKQGMIESNNCKKLLEGIVRFRDMLAKEPPEMDFARGTYYAYEGILRQNLGLSVSGLNHLARSRNDINATLFYLASRDSFRSVSNSLIKFANVLLEKAKSNSTTLLPIYSQHQPAAPGTYGFYLLAIYYPLMRVMEDLQSIENHLNTLPLGAGAGAGTDIALDQDYVAKLLGFKSAFANALDAIANRDFSLRYQAILARLCTVLSRVAQDYQLWTTQEFQLFDLPDNLCGSSSMMPQKKNPYLLELVKSASLDVISSLNNSYCKMHKVPTGNSIEISNAACSGIDDMTLKCSNILELMTLVVDQAIPLRTAIQSSIEKGLTVASFIANQLVKWKKISFREAHLLVGDTIRNALDEQQNPYQALLCLMDQFDSENVNYAESLLPLLKYGGGPNPKNVEMQIDDAQHRLIHFEKWLKNQENQWDKAKKLLKKELEKCCAG